MNYNIIGSNAKFIETFYKNKYFIHVLTGGARTGKTQVVAPIFLELINNSNESDIFAIGTQNKTTFDGVIRTALEKSDSNVDVRHTDSSIVMINNRKVFLYTYSDKDRGKKLRGSEFKAIWMDEAHASPENIFNDLLTRTNRTDCVFFITSNPEGATHWIYRNFILNSDIKGKYCIKNLSEKRKSVVYPSSMTEYSTEIGGHIDSEYIEMLKNTLPDIEVRRLVYGEHVDSIGKIFDISKLSFYDGNIDDDYEIKALIDPAFGQENCFTSCIIYQKKQDKFYLIDSGLLRSNAVDTIDDILIEFLKKNFVNKVYIESNFSQGELAKKLSKVFNVTKFYVRENKIKRIVNQSINIREFVYFPVEWKKVPNYQFDKWISTIQGRGYIALAQLLNFSDIESENCIKGQDLTYIDFPDALSSILMTDKSIIKNSINNTNNDNNELYVDPLFNADKKRTNFFVNKNEFV